MHSPFDMHRLSTTERKTLKVGLVMCFIIGPILLSSGIGIFWTNKTIECDSSCVIIITESPSILPNSTITNTSSPPPIVHQSAPHNIARDLIIVIHVFCWIVIIVFIMASYCYNVSVFVSFNRTATLKRSVDTPSTSVDIVHQDERLLARHEQKQEIIH